MPKSGIALELEKLRERLIRLAAKANPGQRREITRIMVDTVDELLHPLDRLSPMESQILPMLLTGRDTKDLAAEIRMNVKTFHTHRLRIFLKLNVRNDRQLMLYAFEHGLIEITDTQQPGTDATRPAAGGGPASK